MAGRIGKVDTSLFNNVAQVSRLKCAIQSSGRWKRRGQFDVDECDVTDLSVEYRD
jgi:hypothetical protein